MQPEKLIKANGTEEQRLLLGIIVPEGKRKYGINAFKQGLLAAGFELNDEGNFDKSKGFPDSFFLGSRRQIVEAVAGGICGGGYLGKAKESYILIQNRLDHEK